MSDETRPAVRVHIGSSDVPLGAPAPARRRRSVTFRTIVLSSDVPVDQVMQPDPNRVIAYVQAGGADVVLTKSKGDAQANTRDASYSAPVGTLLPFGNTVPYPLETNDEVWVGSAVYPAQVSVTIVTESQE